MKKKRKRRGRKCKGEPAWKGKKKEECRRGNQRKGKIMEKIVDEKEKSATIK